MDNNHTKIKYDFELLFDEEMLALLKKIGKEKTPLIYFSSNTSQINYFFIAQLFYLSCIYKIQKSNFTILLNDIAREQNASINMVGSEEMNSRISEVYTILDYFGVPSSNIVIHRLSEAWKQYIVSNERALVNFLYDTLFFNEKMLEIPLEIANLEFLPPKANYGLSYVLQKHIDVLISSNYSRIFQNEFGDCVDLQVTSAFSYPLLRRISNDLLRQKSAPEIMPEIFPLPKLPFFGNSDEVFHGHIAPEINMTHTEISHAIKIYNLDPKIIRLIFENFLNHALSEFVVFEGKKRILSKEAPELKAESVKVQRLLLGENLHFFLNLIKNQLNSNKQVFSLSFSEESNVLDLCSILRSKLALDVLHLCNGENGISEIARKLGRHQPNISNLVFRLKKAGLVKTNQNKKPMAVSKNIQLKL